MLAAKAFAGFCGSSSDTSANAAEQTKLAIYFLCLSNHLHSHYSNAQNYLTLQLIDKRQEAQGNVAVDINPHIKMALYWTVIVLFMVSGKHILPFFIWLEFLDAWLNQGHY